MIVEYRYNGITTIPVLVAGEGKQLRRIGTNDVFGEELSLGYSYYIEGVKLDEPHLDLPEDFEEIDTPEEEVPEDYDLEEVVEETDIN